MKPTKISRHFTLVLCGITAFALVGGATARATADAVIFDFAGTISEAHDGGGLIHSVFGDLNLLMAQPISGSFGYDTATPPGSDPVAVGAGGYFLHLAVPGNFASISVAGQTGRAGERGWPPGFIVTVYDNDWPLSSDPTDAIDIRVNYVHFSPGGAVAQTSVSPLFPPQDAIGFGLMFEASPGLFSGFRLPNNLNLVDYRVTGFLGSFTDSVRFDLTSLAKREEPARISDGGSTALFLLLCLPAMGVARRVSAAQ